eukprot:11272889-Ditylum_brightwellii.AAC.1
MMWAPIIPYPKHVIFHQHHEYPNKQGNCHLTWCPHHHVWTRHTVLQIYSPISPQQNQQLHATRRRMIKVLPVHEVLWSCFRLWQGKPFYWLYAKC